MMPAYSRSQRAAAGRALAAAALLVATACGVDRVTAPVSRPFVPTLAADAAGVPTAGLGGAWTISPVDAHQFYAQAQQPTGIVLPAGIPVRIVGSGLITKSQTAGVQQFCANNSTICNGDYQKLILGPVLPVN